MRSLALVAALVAALAAAPAMASIHTYENEFFYSVGDAYIYRGGREGLYASTKEAIEKWGTWGQVAPGVRNGQSEIKLSKLEFSRPAAIAEQFEADEGFTGLVQAVIFEVGDRDLIGHPTPSGYRYCCTKDLVAKTKCHQDRLIYQRKADGWPKVLDIYFENNATTAYAWEEAITISQSGMYYLWFVTCDDDLSAVTVAGATEWKNPTGYLPGAMIPLVGLHAVAAAAYGVLLLAWGVAAARHRADVGFLQRAVGGVIALSAAEAVTWAVDYAQFNRTGHRPPASTLYAVLVGCGRRTLARYVALVVSLGAGVVVPVLAPVLRHKVAALCVTYVLASGTAAGLASVGQVDDLTGGARALVGLPVAALDAVFVLWIFSALSRTLAQVAARRAASKLDLYRKFTNLLAVMVWASVAWIAYETYYKVTDPYNERWRFDWVTGAFWVALDFAFTAAVAVMFRPSAAATRFAYSDADAAAASGDAEYEALEKGGGVAAAAARSSDSGSAKIPAGKAGGGGGGAGAGGAGTDGSDGEEAKME